MIPSMNPGAVAAAGSAVAVGPSVVWSAVSHANFTLSNSDLDATLGGPEAQSRAAVVDRLMTAGSKFSIDLEDVAEAGSGHESFGILVSTDGGTVTSVGYLGEDIADHHYGFQPEGSVGVGDVLTLEYDGDAGTLDAFINGVSYGTQKTGINTALSWRFAFGGYGPGCAARIREQVYAPSTGFSKLTA